MKYVYKTQGTCSTNIELEVENNIVKEVAFWGGCNGNLQGISRLVTGMPVSDVITKLKGSGVGLALLHVPTNYAVLCTRWVSKKNKGCI